MFIGKQRSTFGLLNRLASQPLSPFSSSTSFLKDLGIDTSKPIPGVFTGRRYTGSGAMLSSVNPHDQSVNAQITTGTIQEYRETMSNIQQDLKQLAMIPMPVKGEILRELGQEIRIYKEELAVLITKEMGKCIGESIGEVQEVIDMCDFACGLSRTLSGRVLPSERPNHTLLEVWNPLGTVGVITAFNFPFAVLGWNLTLSFLCGNATIWKPSNVTPLVTVATQRIVNRVLERHLKEVPATALTSCVEAGKDIGEAMSLDKQIRLMSFTGSSAVGKIVASQVGSRLGKTLLELGGNGAVIVCEDADLQTVLPAVVFGAVGTTGQRCTTLRRLIIHESLYETVKEKLLRIYPTIKIGDPMDKGNLIGPLATSSGVKTFQEGLRKVKEQGGSVIYGGNVINGNYVQPTIVEIGHSAPIVQEETFAPILYLFKFRDFEEAIQMNNSVPQGLSSGMFTKDIQKMMRWTGPTGSDCGIINVNTGTSGAEIGGAFGGEKETGGGRESGSDSWKQYARRGTCVINHGNNVLLAQGIKFDI